MCPSLSWNEWPSGGKRLILVQCGALIIFSSLCRWVWIEPLCCVLSLSDTPAFKGMTRLFLWVLSSVHGGAWDTCRFSKLFSDVSPQWRWRFSARWRFLTTEVLLLLSFQRDATDPHRRRYLTERSPTSGLTHLDDDNDNIHWAASLKVQAKPLSEGK